MTESDQKRSAAKYYLAALGLIGISAAALFIASVLHNVVETTHNQWKVFRSDFVSTTLTAIAGGAALLSSACAFRTRHRGGYLLAIGAAVMAILQLGLTMPSVVNSRVSISASQLVVPQGGLWWTPRHTINIDQLKVVWIQNSEPTEKRQTVTFVVDENAPIVVPMGTILRSAFPTITTQLNQRGIDVVGPD